MEISSQNKPSIRLPGLFLNRLNRYFRTWVGRRIPPARKITLGHHNIFIMPNKQGLGFCLILFLMFIGAANYEANLAFALVFLLTGMFILSIFYTFRNLAGLQLSAVPGSPVFAGENAEVTVILTRPGKRTHEAISLRYPRSRKVTGNLIDSREVRLNLYLPTRQRGLFSPGRMRIETVFPFGICRAWSLLDFGLNCVVYPKPQACDMDWLSRDVEGKLNVGGGNDDFHNLREYQRGDPLKHVAWKNFARGQGMYTKQYSSNVDDKIWLHWDMFAGHDLEGKLSRLCYCALKLDAAGLDYGLDIPGSLIEPGHGSEHYHQVLMALAMFGQKEAP